MSTPGIDKGFVDRINEARHRQHLSIRALARIAQVPPATAQGWLSGKHTPTPALRANYQVLLDQLGLTDPTTPHADLQTAS